MNISTPAASNAARWAKAKITRGPEFASVAKRLVAPAAKAIYQRITASTGVPWFIIAVIHERECSQNFNGNIAQGDPWNHVSVHVPAGRGPFKSFEAAAFDALVNCAPYAARNKDWSVGAALTKLEEYNGLGYASRGRPSPYIWSGTDQYVSGKYVRDGVYDPNAVDHQLGCAGLLLAMMALDPSISFHGDSKVPEAPKVAPVSPKAHAPSQSSQPSLPAQVPARKYACAICDLVSSLFAAIFKRK